MDKIITQEFRHYFGKNKTFPLVVITASSANKPKVYIDLDETNQGTNSRLSIAEITTIANYLLSVVEAIKKDSDFKTE